MPLFPKVDSPCPYKSRLSAVMDGDFCRMCRRQVFDLTAMSDAERGAFLSGCAEEVCVSYRLPLRTAIAAAALATSVTANPASARQPAAPPAELEIPDELYEASDLVIVVGGIRDPAKAEWVEAKEDVTLPELPVVHEDGAPASEQASPTAPPVADTSRS